MAAVGSIIAYYVPRIFWVQLNYSFTMHATTTIGLRFEQDLILHIAYTLIEPDWHAALPHKLSIIFQICMRTQE